MENLMNLMDSRLKEKGYKLTVQRKTILGLLIEHSDKHLSPDEIYELLRKKHPQIGLATVYRTLLLFEQLGLIYKSDFDDGSSRYELNKQKDDHRHHHLICTQCGNVEEAHEDLLENLEEEILKTNDFLVQDHRVKFYGLCKKCRNS